MPKAASPFPPETDLLSRFGSLLLCMHIAEFWRVRGFSVSCERFQVPDTESWGVRSNLVNGLPGSAR